MTTATIRALRMTMAIVLGTLGGCADTSSVRAIDASVIQGSVQATDGSVIQGSVLATDGSVVQGAVDAVHESAASDLKCADSIDVKDVSLRHTTEYVAVGCGYRVQYRITYQASGQAQVVELSRSRESTSNSP